jgi:hypothetical protein
VTLYARRSTCDLRQICDRRLLCRFRSQQPTQRRLCVAFAAESKDRALTAEQSLQEAEKRITVLEAQVAAAERRAGEAEQMLVRVEDAIRSEILEPRSRKAMAA